VVECGDEATASQLYSRVDGLEWEHSSAAINCSFIPPDVSFEGRQVRDQAFSTPAGYAAPDFVLSAKQQSKVKCTWDEDDPNRARRIDRLRGPEGDADDEDLKGILANVDSDEDDEDESGEDESGGDGSEAGSEAEGDETKEPGGGKAGGKGKKKSKAGNAEKKAKLRALMGLGGGSDSDSDGGSDAGSSLDGFGGDGDGGFGDEHEFANEFVATDWGKEEKLRAALDEKRKGGQDQEETPWEKVQRKAAEKKRERRAARKARLKSGHDPRAHQVDSSTEEEEEEEGEGPTDADFFLSDEPEIPLSSSAAAKAAKKVEPAAKGSRGKKSGWGKEDAAAAGGESSGSEDEEEARNYDMRAVVRADKLRGKKLKGARARKEAKRAAAAGLSLDPSATRNSLGARGAGGAGGPQGASGSTGFKLDLADRRFSAVLDGDERFGLDPTASAFKGSDGMRSLLEEQRRRRRDRSDQRERDATRGGGGGGAAPQGKGTSGGNEGRAAGDFSSLVSSLKKRSIPPTAKAGEVKRTKKKSKASDLG